MTAPHLLTEGQKVTSIGENGQKSLKKNMIVTGFQNCLLDIKHVYITLNPKDMSVISSAYVRIKIGKSLQNE